MKLGIIGGEGVEKYSLSPVMHTAALKACGLKGEYRAIPVKPEGLESWLGIEAPKLDGFNVTMPHKEAVYRWLKENGRIGSDIADSIGAVNTVKVVEEKGVRRLVGYNTDGRGFFDTVGDQNALRGKSVLLLGAGGAAKAIAVWLAEATQIGSLKIWNRHLERAEELAQKVNTLQTHCRAVAVKDLRAVPIEQMSLIVNATPLGMHKHEESPLDFSRLRKGQAVYDIVYEPRETRLIAIARKHGCKVIRGDEMLAAQGAEAFDIWTDEWRGGKPVRVDGKFIREIMGDALENEIKLRAGNRQDA